MSHVTCIATIKPKENETIKELEDRVENYLLANCFLGGGRYTSSAYDSFEIMRSETRPVTEELYNNELQEHEGECDGEEPIVFMSIITFTDIDEEQCSPEFIGTKYAVYLDCHY